MNCLRRLSRAAGTGSSGGRMAVSRLSSVRKISSSAPPRARRTRRSAPSARMVPLPGRLAGPAALEAADRPGEDKKGCAKQRPGLTCAQRDSGVHAHVGAREDHCRTPSFPPGLFGGGLSPSAAHQTVGGISDLSPSTARSEASARTVGYCAPSCSR